MINDNFQKLRRLISEDKILLLPHKKYKGIRQLLVYTRCGISKKYFEKAYNKGDVILQMGELGPRIGHPIPWEQIFEEGSNKKNEKYYEEKDKIIKNFAEPRDTIIRFEEDLHIQRDQLFGITLFLQCVELMYAGQPETLEMNRQSFQNIKERAESSISAAESLLQLVKADPGKVKELRRFQFPPIGGHPMLDQMTQRAQILVETYERLFPGRSRSDPLTREELESLMIDVADRL
jgi:hypothetical protein